MNNSVTVSRERSRIYQLLSIAFGHPVPELHAQLADGRFQQAFDDGFRAICSRPAKLPAITEDFTDFEARYIDLFAVGNRSRPAVPLCAGDYEALTVGRTRPAFMLQFITLYECFGLKISDDGQMSELPDHLTCQLEFMAWLCHLEADALAEGRAPGPYRHAQFDFIEKLFHPFSMILTDTVTKEAEHGTADEVFSAMLSCMAAMAQHDATEIKILIEDSQVINPAKGTHTKARADENLWG